MKKNNDNILENPVRVAAFMSIEKGVAEYLGEGYYIGDFTPPEGIVKAPLDEIIPDDWKIPKIELDNGDVVWGCECYWGEANKIKRYLQHADIKEVRIGDYRI
jgi:hypothetical protein